MRVLQTHHDTFTAGTTKLNSSANIPVFYRLRTKEPGGGIKRELS
jgi:hypothetical protein